MRLPHGLRSAPAAAAVLVGSSLLFALMAVLARSAAARLPGPQIAFVRFAISCLACAAAAARLPLRVRNRVGLLLRGLFGGGAVLCYFVTVQHLPAGIATLLLYTAPLFTAIWAALFLHEPLERRSLGALAVTLAGVGFVLRGQAPPGALGIGPWQLLGMFSAVLSGAAVATIREVRKTDGSWEIFSALSVAGALLTLPLALPSWVAPTAREWLLLGAIGGVSVAAQLGFTFALRYVRATVAGIIAQLTPIGALALGWVWQGERLAGAALLGVAVALGGISWGAWLAARPSTVAEDP